MHAKKNIYDNIKMLSPENYLMCYINKKKAHFYIKNNLAIKLSDGSIKLLFKPKGPGNKNIPFYLEKRNLSCVVCGLNKDLTSHHVVPRKFAKIIREYSMLAFNKYFLNNSHDVVALCCNCHVEYEKKSELFKDKILAEDGFDPNWHKEITKIENCCFGATNTLKKHLNKIPKPKIEKLNSIIRYYFGKNFIELSEKEINEKLSFIRSEKNIEPKKYIKFVLDNDKICEFMYKWRRHFIDSMNPKFLSELWDVNYNNVRG